MNPTINEDDQYIYKTLKRFKLLDIWNNYNDLINTHGQLVRKVECKHKNRTYVIKEAKEEKLDYKRLLIKLIQYEEQGKQRRMVERYIKAAGFNKENTIENYDFTFHAYRHKTKIMELASLSFMDRNENIIFLGPPGVVKIDASNS